MAIAVVLLGGSGELPLAAIDGVAIFKAVDTLHRLVAFVRDGAPLLDPPASGPEAEPDRPDLADVAGQALGRRAIEVAAAGGHHVALLGPPGAGRPGPANDVGAQREEADSQPTARGLLQASGSLRAWTSRAAAGRDARCTRKVHHGSEDRSVGGPSATSI
jgi:hypothetical protein